MAEEDAGRASKRAANRAGKKAGIDEREAHAQAAGRRGANQQSMQQAAELISDNFSRERDRFLLRVEHEVVELALAVSARILRREAQMDPLLLTGARCAWRFGQLSSDHRRQGCVCLLPNSHLWTEVHGS
jgi:flagellar biosynthesis/type III secretory pathway protein FliH